MKKSVLLTLVISLCFLCACTTTSPNPSSLSPSQIAEVNNYVDSLILKLDMLYDKFEEGEAHAEQIADERQAPYWMAIGYMAEVRKVADEVESLAAPEGAQSIRTLALSSLRSWQAGLDEIASKEAEDVKLTDPGTFYQAYLDVLIEIPELKAELSSMADAL